MILKSAFFSKLNDFLMILTQVARALEGRAHIVQPHLVVLLREHHSPVVLESVLKRIPDSLQSIIVRGNLHDNKVK